VSAVAAGCALLLLAGAANAAGTTGAWTNVTSNLANMPSECGNLTMLSAVPGSGAVIAGVATRGLWQSSDGGASWARLGSGPGSANITNRPSWLAYDPRTPTVFWESGIYNGGGAYKTTDAGNTFVQLGPVTHDDFISVDFAHPDRKTLLVGGHERAQTVWKSTDGGQTWANIGANLPDGTGFSSDPLLLDAQTYVVNADRSWSQGAPGIFRTTDGGATWAKVSAVGPSGPPLVAADGTIYWSAGDALVKSTDRGMSWSRVGGGLANAMHPIQLPDGRLVTASQTTLVASGDGGQTWSPIGPQLPYAPAGVVYSPGQKAFFIWHWDCGNKVLPDAIEVLSYDAGAAAEATPAPTSVPADNAVAPADTGMPPDASAAPDTSETGIAPDDGSSVPDDTGLGPDDSAPTPASDATDQ
jgi:photosystem II stability/assembly factor-like uncharacterized protein